MKGRLLASAAVCVVGYFFGDDIKGAFDRVVDANNNVDQVCVDLAEAPRPELIDRLQNGLNMRLLHNCTALPNRLAREAHPNSENPDVELRDAITLAVHKTCKNFPYDYTLVKEDYCENTHPYNRHNSRGAVSNCADAIFLNTFGYDGKYIDRDFLIRHLGRLNEIITDLQSQPQNLDKYILELNYLLERVEVVGDMTHNLSQYWMGKHPDYERVYFNIDEFINKMNSFLETRSGNSEMVSNTSLLELKGYLGRLASCADSVVKQYPASCTDRDGCGEL